MTTVYLRRFLGEKRLGAPELVHSLCRVPRAALRAPSPTGRKRFAEDRLEHPQDIGRMTHV